MKIAVCIDIPEFSDNRLSERAYASRYPGAGWIYELYRLGGERGFEVASGDVAIRNINSGRWRASETWIIQEMSAKAGRVLRAMGARPLLLTCFESPIYAPLFYDRMSSIARKFPYHMLPGYPTNGPSDGPQKGLVFPSYWSNGLTASINWTDRSDLVLVASNKHWRSRRRLSPRPLTLARQLRYEIQLQFSRSHRGIGQAQLLDRRLDLVEILIRAGRLTVFGSGWQDLSHLPRYQQDRLAGLSISSGSVDDKIETLGRYKFALCIENAEWPGYVTEKVIDSIIAGSVPLYLGAPDIADYLPSDCFVDLRRYTDGAAMLKALDTFDESEGKRMIAAGRTFLASESGMRHSYEGFSRWVLSLADTVCR